MEVNKSYIEFLLQLLNNEENLNIDRYQEELTVNLYLSLLSLSNLEYSDNIDQIEKETISDFLRKLNNLKVKIQLRRKPEETNKLAEELINQYYENINILSIYIKDGIELENVINTMDAKSLTQLIDTTTKDKMNKEYSKEDRNAKRIKLLELLPVNEYYIENNMIYIKNNDTYENISIENFIEMFSYLLNPDNYSKLYTDKSSQTAHELVIANTIKTLIVNDKKIEELTKIVIPVILTYVSSFDMTNYYDLDTSKFNIENILISELYSLASNNDNNNQNINTPKWRNISLPNNYLLNKLQEMIHRGMYYIKDNTFILEHTDKKTSDFKVSINIEDLKQILKTILESKLENNYSKKI